MKRFILHITLITTITIGLCLLLDCCITNLLQHSENREYMGWNGIIYNQTDADMLIIGSSRALVQYSPAILDSILHINSYNLGIDGSYINRQIVKYRVYRYYQTTRPTTAILCVDMFSVSGWKVGFEREQFFPYMKPFSYTREQFTNLEPMTWKERYLPLYRYLTHQGLLKTFLDENVDDHIYKGYQGQNTPWDGKAFNELSAYHVDLDSCYINLLEDFVRELQQDSIKVIFCSAPIYSGMTKKVDNMDQVNATFTEIAQTHHVPLLDYTNMDISNDSTYFYNASHLNQQGAEIFTTQLSNDLKEFLYRP